MILRSTLRTPVPFDHPGPARPAHELFLSVQLSCLEPHAFVPQVAHSALTGQLAAALSPGIFGELPPEVVEAAAKHDLGWGQSDERLLASGTPRPFAHAPGEELPSWRRSLEMAQAWSPLTRVLIGRHFSTLASKPTEPHGEFLATDARKIDAEAAALPSSAEQLARWTDAVGFCDLVSLYLSTGVRAPASFPLAHPASEHAASSQHISVSWEGDQLRTSRPIFRPGVELRAEMVHASGHTEPLAWTVA